MTPTDASDIVERRPGLPPRAGLDGIRALAVAAVLVYHADATWLPGGFLGVEVFFVLSGYLITTLLLDEHQRAGVIDLGSFWIRRARRLLPALGLLLLGVPLLAMAFAPDALDGMRRDIVASVLYVNNWSQILADQSYFDAFGRPSPFQHLWSLAVEEQFYLLWPVVVIAVLPRYGRRGLAMLAAGGALASTLLMAVLHTPLTDPSRVYYGTDTRAGGLLIGAVVACVWRPWATSRVDPRQWPGVVADVIGVLALAAVAWATFSFSGDLLEGDRLYPGGFLWASLPTALAIVAIVTPGSRLDPVLGHRVLRWIGVRSYAIYLWHWPVFVMTRPRLDVSFDGPLLLILRLGITLALADLSFRLVEQPLRRGDLAGALDLVRRRLVHPRGRRIVGGAVASLALLGLATATGPDLGGPADLPQVMGETLGGTAAAEPGTDATGPTDPATGGTVAGTGSTPGGAQSTGTAPSTPDGAPAATSAPGAPPTSAGATTGSAVTLEPGPIDPAAAARSNPRVAGFGDSVLLGAAPEFAAQLPAAVLDARIGRQWWDAPDELDDFLGADLTGTTVIVHLGNNGNLTPAMFDDVLRRLSTATRVIVVTVRVPAAWEGEVNQVIREGVTRWPNAVVADWHALANDHPEYFADDGVHIGRQGLSAYVGLVSALIPAG